LEKNEKKQSQKQPTKVAFTFFFLPLLVEAELLVYPLVAVA
jgi:hypothetical protein